MSEPTPDPQAPSRSGPAWTTAAVGAACLAGATARAWNVRDQVLGGDELHAVATALAKPLGWILTHYSLADYSIPLTAGLRVWRASGGTLTELGMRVPGLVCGVLLVPLVAIAARRALGGGVAARLAWLVALSPVLVLYSRIVRSYAPMVLFATAAAIAAFAWIETRTRRAAVVYVACAALATWFHLGAGPFVAAPLVFAVALRATQTERDATPSGRAIVLTGAGLVLAFWLFLAPARASLFALLGGVRQPVRPGPAAWRTVAELQLGAPDAALALVALGLAVLGLATLARTRPRLAAFGATLVAGQITGLLVLSPAFFEYAFILNRYLLVCTPVLLLWIAVGLGALAPARPHAVALATAAFLAIGFARGPLARASFLHGSFVHHNDRVSFERERLRVDPAAQPRFYQSLAADPAGALVEIPWHPWWNYSRVFAADQGLHGRRVLVSGTVAELTEPGVAFRNFVAPDPASLAAADAAWVVVHLDVEAEQARLVGVPADDDSLDVAPPQVRARVWQSLRRQAAEIATQLEAAWGSADHVEPGLVAWKLPRTPRTVTTPEEGRSR